MLKKFRASIVGVVVATMLALGVASGANAAIVAPRLSNDGDAALWNCSGPYYNWSWHKYEYWCYYDYTWFAEVFKGKHDYWGYADAWYTA